MSLVIVLDSSPLGLLASPIRTPEVQRINLWAERQALAGNRLVAPAIADFEVRRELERLRKTRSLAHLDQFEQAEPDRYVPPTDQALRLAATLWAQARNRGMPTADFRELDCDVLISAQALTLGVPLSDLVVATSNVGHLSQFVPAALWDSILP